MKKLLDQEFGVTESKYYDVNFERQLIDLGETPSSARRLTLYLGEVQENSLFADKEWQDIIHYWQKIVKNNER
jgi:hypothetical protein